MIRQDEFWVCQSCGIKQTEEKHTGNVVVDHSQEIENLLIRANQFREKGDNEKALEYFNRALDLDPYNETALSAVNSLEVDAFAEADEDVTLTADKLYVSKRAVSTQDGIRNFFNALYKEEVAPDVYSNIKIVSVSERYYLAALADADYTATYQATACYNRSVPHTVYKEETVYAGGIRNTRRRPVTEYFEEFDHSEDVLGEISGNSREGYIFSESMLSLLLENKCTSLRNNLCEYIKTDFDISTLIPLQDLLDPSETGFDKIEEDVLELREKVAVENFINIAKSDAGDVAEYQCPGDFSTNMSIRLDDCNLNWNSFYIPVQIIEYEYKGKQFIALQTMCAGETILTMTYPHREEIQQETQNNKQEISVSAEESPEEKEPEVDIGFSDGSKLALLILIVAVFPYLWFTDHFFLLILGVAAVVGVVIGHYKKVQRQRQKLKNYDERKVLEREGVDERIAKEKFEYETLEFKHEKFVYECESEFYRSWKTLTEMFEKSADYEAALEKVKNTHNSIEYSAYSSRSMTVEVCNVEINQPEKSPNAPPVPPELRPRVIIVTGTRRYHYNKVEILFGTEEYELKGLERKILWVEAPTELTFKEGKYFYDADAKKFNVSDDEISVFRVEYTNNGFEIHNKSKKLAELNSKEEIDSFVSGVLKEYEAKDAEKNVQKVNFAEIVANWKRKTAQRKVAAEKNNADVPAEGVTASTEETVKDVPKEKTAKKSKKESNGELEKVPSKFNEIAAKIAKIIGIGLLVVVGLFIVLMLFV